MGTIQFLAVPYALYAQKSLEPGPPGPKGHPVPKGMPVIRVQITRICHSMVIT